MKDYYIYILTNKKDGTLYISVTNNLMRRVYGHKNGVVKGFTKKYNLNKLVHYERAWKIKLIESLNPEWKDLSESFS